MGIKSFDQLKAAVEAVALKKQAAELSLPKDPNEVSVPSTKEDGMISEKCMNVPEGKANDKAVEKETSSLPVKDSSEESAIKPKEEQSVKVTEQSVTKKGSELLKKIQGALKAKTASEETPKENIAKGIDLSVDALAKIASEILNTEEGAKFAHSLFRKKAGEEYAAQAIKEASEQAMLYKQQENMLKNPEIKKIASVLSTLSEKDQEIFMNRLSVHKKNLDSYDHEILKKAYAAGAEDAEGVLQDPTVLGAAEEPTAEDAGVAEITPEEVVEAVNEMLNSGEIDKETADVIVETIVGKANEDAAEAEAVSEAPVEEVPANDVPVSPEEEAAAANALQAAAAEGPAKLASEIVKGTILLKKASAEDDSEASIEDVIAVVNALQEEGSISEEDAKNVIDEIMDAIDAADAVDSDKKDVEDDDDDKEEDDDDDDDDDKEEASDKETVVTEEMPKENVVVEETPYGDIEAEVEKTASELGIK